MSKEMKKDLKKSQCVNKVDEMMSSSSESEVEFSGDEAYDNGSNAFSFEPEYTEEEIQERLRQYTEQNETRKTPIDFVAESNLIFRQDNW